MTPSQGVRRLLLTGASGFLGQHLLQALKHTPLKIFAASRQRPGGDFGAIEWIAWDADQTPAEDLLAEVRPNGIVHLAALANAAECYQHTEQAYHLNVEVTQALGEWAAAHRIPLVFTSTDLVFDGHNAPYHETDLPSPTSVYAQTKLAAEQTLEKAFASQSDCLTIFRIALSYGWAMPNRPGPIGAMLEKLRRGERVLMFEDEYRTPLFAWDFARAVWDTLNRPGLSGMFHLGGSQRLSRYQIGLMMASQLGFDPALVVRSSIQGYSGAEPRPADCSLCVDHFRACFGWKPCSFEQGLAQVAASPLRPPLSLS